MEALYRFRIISEYNYEYGIPVIWQAWHEAYFDLISHVLKANGEWVRLKDDGCTMPEYKTPDCIRTCSNATSMFYSEANVWNCISLATVSMEVIHGNKPFDKMNVASIDKIFDLGGSDLYAIDQLHIFDKIRSCFWQSCSDSDYGMCTPKIEPYENRNINASNIHDFASVVNGSYCQTGSPGIDSDIAGPGIIVSYIIQLALVFLLASIFSFFAFYDGWRRSANRIMEPSRRPPCKVPKRVKSLIASLQEAQGSFVFSVSLIYLVAFDHNAIGLSNNGSPLSITINRNIGYGLMIIGTSSVAFLHYFARRSDMHWLSCHILLLSNCLMLARANHIYQKSPWVKPEGFLDGLRENAAVAECGKNPGPMSFCLAPRVDRLENTQKTFPHTRRMAPAVYVFCVLLLVEDILLQFVFARLSKSIRKWLDSPTFIWFSFFLHFLWAIPLGFGMADVVNSFKMLELLNSGERSWSFGQFVAVSIWGPLCLKLVVALIIWLLPRSMKDLLNLDPSQ